MEGLNGEIALKTRGCTCLVPLITMDAPAMRFPSHPKPDPVLGRCKPTIQKKENQKQ